ncbi:hypothetical protein TFLX_00419 [Thermoflexales bacterium]|nr:hypothetical protein TFLX_00419 [Thermoflexales bacterium]
MALRTFVLESFRLAIPGDAGRKHPASLVDKTMVDPVYGLLALCARAQCGPQDDQQLRQAAAQVTDWAVLPALAEAQGMSPLAYRHLHAAAVPLPSTVKRQLQALAARQRQANRIRFQVLRDILAAYQEAGLAVIVLKGAALACLIYPEPGLRPMSDLDLLVRTSDLARAINILTEQGFTVPAQARSIGAQRHLEAAALQIEGLPVHVELHHKLHDAYFDYIAAHLPRSLARWLHTAVARSTFEITEQKWQALQPFALADVTARALGNEDMLIHLCQHLTSHVNAWDSPRLIWVADIVSWAERYATAIDWERLRQQYPPVLNTLSLLHAMTPLSENLRSCAKIKVGKAPSGIGIDFQGWPRIPRTAWRAKGYRRVWFDTLYPSDWWLRLRYRLGCTRSLAWYRWVRHPLYIMGHVVRVLLEKLGWPTFSKLKQNPRR